MLLIASHSGTQTEGDSIPWVLWFSWWRMDSQEMELEPTCLLKACAQTGAVTSTLILLVKATQVGTPTVSAAGRALHPHQSMAMVGRQEGL